MNELGFVGLGQMGAPMAERLIGPDVRLHVFDRSDQATARLVSLGAVAHTSPRELADAASIVFACLPSPAISETVATGPDGIASGSAVRVYAEMSTIGRECIRSIAQHLAGRGIRTVDAPVSGGPPAARAGTLAMMAAGPPEDVAAVSPWLAKIGLKVHVLGLEVGQAQVMKLVNNIVMAANMIVAAEGLVMAAKSGLDPAVAVEVLNAGTGRSAACSDIIARSALPGAFDFGARLAIVAKDVLLGLEQARELRVPVPVIEAAGALWAQASEEGRDHEDFSAIVKLIEKRGGAEIRRRT